MILYTITKTIFYFIFFIMLTNIFFFKLKNQENQNRSVIVKFKVGTAQTTQSADDQPEALVRI